MTELEPKEEKKKSSAAAKKKKDKKSLEKRKREVSNVSVVESSEYSSVECQPNRKCSILHIECSHSTDNCKDLRAMINKYKQRKWRNYNFYGKRYKEHSALIEKKFEKIVKNKKKRKTEKELQHFWEIQKLFKIKKRSKTEKELQLFQ